ncbi:uncharacterized protein zgc:112980 isoform X2 [Takifugu flavidus]|uniref:uncharacterized protein zgc:112980 isoform X2 n=1 Tax=Takifugu flavidus TaxID=433684 RepID=UPI002544CD63|nr:uncharacterized protein zgc:112980 isoform X2 [Takifugu flavidus]
MGTTANDIEVIILSDDEDEAPENDVACDESSVYIVEPEDSRETDTALTPSTLEEDLVVTFSRRAEVLPHARYDCPIHPFTAEDRATDAPLAGNQLICDQCFCYICDKLASSCVLWCQGGICHCNSHKRSTYWSNLRDSTVLGDLQAFNLTVSEVDEHLRRAEKMLLIFKKEAFVQFSIFLRGQSLMEYGPNAQHQKRLIHDYTPVYELVSSFLYEADKQNDRAAAILRLGAAEVFIRHVSCPGSLMLPSPVADVNKAKACLLHRVISSLQRQLVMADFTPEFRQKIQDFYRRFPLPIELKNFRNSLCVRPWTDILLVSVLKGQNISGVRKEGKKKDVLAEDMSVIFLRSELLQRQKRYRELCRYLRVVQSAEAAFLQQLRDLIPFFMCLAGDFSSALIGFLPAVNAPASRFTPQLFLIYFYIFKSATAPQSIIASHPFHLCRSDAVWEPIKGAVPLKRELLVKFALKVHRCCPAVYADSQCWTSLLTVVNSLGASGVALPAPSPKFLLEAKDSVNAILLEQIQLHIQIPRPFLEEYPDQALLLLVTGALGFRIVEFPLRPVLPVLSTFQGNLWALQWLWGDLPFGAEHLGSFLQDIRQELKITKGGGCFLQFLNSLLHRWP